MRNLVGHRIAVTVIIEIREDKGLHLGGGHRGSEKQIQKILAVSLKD